MFLGNQEGYVIGKGLIVLLIVYIMLYLASYIVNQCCTLCFKVDVFSFIMFLLMWIGLTINHV